MSVDFQVTHDDMQAVLTTIKPLSPVLDKIAREVVADILAHKLYGPKRPTWGIEVSLDFIQDVGRRSAGSRSMSAPFS